MYSKLYHDTKNMLHLILVELDKDGRVGRVYTSYIARDSKSRKNKARATLENKLQEAKEIIFMRTDNRRARPESGPAAQSPSQKDAPLQQPGNNNIPPQAQQVNEGTAETQQQAEGDGNQTLTSDTQRAYEPSMPQPNRESTGQPVTIADIRKKIEELIPWRHGNIKGRGILGIFKIKPEVMRSKYRNDLPVIMHELGHFLEKRLGLAKKTNPAIEQELEVNGRVTSGENYTPEQIRGEGIAQFFLHYTVNEDEAIDKFPEYYKLFTENLENHPELKSQIDDIQKLVTDYFRQTPEERLDAAIVHGTDKTDTGIWEMIQNLWRKTYDAWVDELAPLKRISDEIRDKLELKYLPDELNVYARARTSAGYRGKAVSDTAGMVRYRDRPDREEQKMTEWPFIRSFITQPMRGDESIDRFYEIYDQTQRSKNGYAHQLKAGRNMTPGKDVKYAELFSSTYKDISELRKARAAIQQHPKLAPKEKREQMDRIDAKMIDIARMALKKYDEAN